MDDDKTTPIDAVNDDAEIIAPVQTHSKTLENRTRRRRHGR